MSKLYPGNNVPYLLTFKDGAGNLYDPDSITCQYFTPDKVLLDTKTKEDCTRESEGVFTVNYKLPSDAAAGVWTLRVNSTYAATGVDRTAEFTFSVSTQPYGSLSMVKSLCSIQQFETEFDEELLRFMEKATEYVNDFLRSYVCVPLVVVPAVVAEVAELRAAGLYLMKNQPDEKPHGYLSEAKTQLDIYLKNTYMNVTRKGKVRATKYLEIQE